MATRGAQGLAPSPLIVYVEKPDLSLGDLMNAIRTWLDRQKVEPAEFKMVASDGAPAACVVRFRNEYEAEQFRLTFASA